MVKIRLARFGSKKNPIYRVVAADCDVNALLSTRHYLRVRVPGGPGLANTMVTARITACESGTAIR